MKNDNLRRQFGFAIFCLIIIGLSACAHKKPATVSHPRTFGAIQDLRDFPQDLEVFAKATGPDRLLLDRETQDSMDSRFDDVYFGPWHMRRTTIKKKEIAALFKNARGYKNATVIWTQPEWDAMAANARLSSFPSRAQAAITLRNTDLRELPSHEPRFTEATPDIKKNPFDYFQYSLLPIGTPLLVAHTSADGLWHYVECPIAGGWVDARDVAFVDNDFINLWQRGAYAALIRDNVLLPGTGGNGRESKSGIGAILPIAGRDDNSINVMIPLPGPAGFAMTGEIPLSTQDATPKPLRLTAANVAKIGNAMMAQPYGWGGTLGNRDCSALTRDIFTPFGIWLPRNSVAQARRGTVIPMDGLSGKQKEALILREGEPFITLLGMRGHIMLYVGKWKGRPAIFHNVWGVRIVEDGDDDARHVIGKAVVTSITPGMELNNLYLPTTFVDRLRALTRLGRR